ncbi:MAG: tetratricopeptide repeat protein [Terriglobia bacterium]
MARLTRQELKKDEFADRLANVTGFFARNRRRIVVGGGAALLGVAVVVGVFLFVRSRQASASDAFGKALVSFHAPVVAQPAPGLTILTFKTAEEKYRAALSQFTDVSSQYGRYQQGRWARYYTALCKRELGQTAEAEQDLAALGNENDGDLAAVSKMALAALYQKASRTEDAEKVYRELETNPTAIVPKATVQIALAELLQRTNPSRATALYQQIEKDYPGTAAADQAARMLRGSGPADPQPVPPLP